MGANEKQVGGDHYKSSIQHWDYVVANELDYFQAQITKYVSRWKKKAGIADLEKAMHFLEKYIEVEKAKIAIPSNGIAIPSNGNEILPIDRIGKIPRNRSTIEYPSPYGYEADED